jgi:hypothetical protein
MKAELPFLHRHAIRCRVAGERDAVYFSLWALGVRQVEFVFKMKILI